MTLRHLLATTLSVLSFTSFIPMSAEAAAPSDGTEKGFINNMYASVNYIGAFQKRSSSTLDVAPPNNSQELSYKPSGGFSAALGYKPEESSIIFGRSRFEIEGMMIRSDVRSFNNGIASSSANGTFENLALMFNLTYPFLVRGNFKPYMGVGVGMTSAKLSYFNPFTNLQVSKEEALLAYQAKVGVRYSLESMPEVSYNLGYRYFSSQPLEIDNISYSNHIHNVELGVSLNF